MTFRRLLAILAFLSLYALPLAAKTVYVSTTGNDNNDGLSWTSAKKTIQAGVNAASFGDSVWVSKGIYTELVQTRDGVALYGGFSGGESLVDQRCAFPRQAPDSSETVIDCDYKGSGVTVPISATSATRIDGFTIRKGSGTVLNGSAQGGGINCKSNASPVIANNTIMFCKLTGAWTSGGGIYSYGGSPIITNNTIVGNTAPADWGGGGIYCSHGSPQITNNRIIGNSTITGDGGGIFCMYCDYAIIANNIISGNSDGDGFGGGIHTSSKATLICNNTIIENNCIYGGAIRCGAGTEVVNNIIAFNSRGINYDSTSVPYIHDNCIYNPVGDILNNGTRPGPGEINQDPRLELVGFGRVHLLEGSPCINAGQNAVLSPDWKDMDGLSRIVGDRVDFGADEFDGTAWNYSPMIVRVSLNGNDANDGSSWAKAKRTIQAAIDLVSLQGGEVWVAKGTYNERISLRMFVHVYGGFQGIETSRSERNFKQNVTTIDGNFGGSVVTAASGYKASTIDGFTITNGTGTIYTTTAAPTSTSIRGGGIYCLFFSPTISNNIITGNCAKSTTAGVHSFGGGIDCWRCWPIIANNTITNNVSSVSTDNGYSNGGGICHGNEAADIRNNIITNNSAIATGQGSFGYGGGIYTVGDSSIVSGNIVSANSASLGGGIYSQSTGATSVIANNTVTYNKCKISGGGIYLGYNSSGKAFNNIVAFNTSGIYKSNQGYYTETGNNCCYGNDKDNYLGLVPSATDISKDPLFVNGTAGNFHITVGSPCINAGLTSATDTSAFDIDGEPRVRSFAVDIGADECWLGAPSPRDAKLSLNGTLVGMAGAVATAVIGDSFYIESEDRTSGIRVYMPGHGVTVGTKVYVDGEMTTDPQGECSILGNRVRIAEKKLISPLELTNLALGGGALGLQGAVWNRQRPTIGLNNIGLLVRTCGKVTQIDPDGKFFYIDDGSGLKDDTTTGIEFNKGVRIAGDGKAYTTGQFVTVTGISSCFKGDDGKIRRLVKPVSIQSN